MLGSASYRSGSVAATATAKMALDTATPMPAQAASWAWCVIRLAVTQPAARMPMMRQAKASTRDGLMEKRDMAGVLCGEVMVCGVVAFLF